jgi:hypothetical protein
VVDIGFGLFGKVYGFRVAAALEVEDAMVIPEK